MLLNDRQIEEVQPLSPFIDHMVSDGVVSYGLSSYGYDIRLDDKWKIFTDVNQTVIDPKDFSEGALITKASDEVLIPPNSFLLAKSMEKFDMPSNLFALVMGKSTYARCGIIVNTTPIEPGWIGYLTIEISNTTPLPAKLYAGEGIAQVVFFQGEEPDVDYAMRAGKYQNQEDIELSHVHHKPQPAPIS